MRMTNGRLLILAAGCLVLAACGGGGGSSSGGSSSSGSSSSSSGSSSPTVETGVFVDSPVEGLHYATATQNGTTNASGEFSYIEGEDVTFSIGDIAFPAVAAAAVVSPFDLANTTDVNDISLINMARLLQSLDLDDDVSNGIEIGSDAHLNATGLSVQFDDPDFDTVVTNLVANGGSGTGGLIDGATAINHLQATVNPDTGCLKTHPYVGRVATLTTYFHNVSGTATFIDNCTIEVTNFNYDGGGPDVYFYGGSNGEYDAPVGFAIGSKINGTVFNDETVTLTLPEGKELHDFDGLAVWCVQAKANFGSGMFQAP